MNIMAKTIDIKIEILKYGGFGNLSRENLLSNLSGIESLVFETTAYKLFSDDAEPIDVLQEWANDGGSKNYDS
jgi:hypothetical protein